jgi:Protein of unknown function (DUF1573)
VNRRGKRFVFAIGLVAATMVAVFTVCFHRVSPKIDTVQIEYDFGAVHPGMSYAHRFTITNEFGSAITFTKLVKSCGCISVGLAKAVIGTGESTTMDLVFHTSLIPEPKNLEVLAEGDTAGRSITYDVILRAKGENVIDIKPDKPTIDLGQCYETGMPKSETIEITRGAFPLDWSTLACKSDSDTVLVELTPIDGNRWRLNLTFRPTNVLGAFRSHLHFGFFRAGVQLPYDYDIPIDAAIVGAMRADPSSVLFGAVPDNVVAQQRIDIVDNDAYAGSTCTIQSVKMIGQNVHATVVNDGRNHFVLFTIVGDGSGESRRGEAIIRCVSSRPYSVGVNYAALMLK